MHANAPGMEVTWKNMIATFMKVGTGLGATGTVSNNGPVTHRVSTTVMNTSASAPTAAHHFTGAAVRGASTTGLDVSVGLTSERVIVRFLSMQVGIDRDGGRRHRCHP